MSLRYILDGYNLIMSGPSGLFEGRILQEQRARLIDLITRHRPQGSIRNSVVVVFDGRGAAGSHEPPGFNREHAGEIEILYSEGQSADDLIEELVLTSPRPAECVVVTDDRGIRRILGTSGARFVSVREFAARLSGRGAESADAHENTDTAEAPPGGWPWK